MKLSHLLLLVSPIAVVLGCARPGWAEPRTSPPYADLLLRSANETGFTVGELFDHHLWALARHPLAGATLDAVGGVVHHTPQRGLQFELLTPGDFGATLHLRW